MHESTINALITALGSLLGGIIGARATIESAKIKEKVSPIPGNTTSKSLLLGIIGGAVIGAIITFVILTIFSPSETPNTTDMIAGNWSGTVVDEGTNDRLQVEIFIEKGCVVNEICGQSSLPDIQCTANLRLTQIEDRVFIFTEQDTKGGSICVSGGQDSLELLSDGTLSRKFVSVDKSITSYGILNRK